MDERTVEAAARLPIIVNVALHPWPMPLPGVYDRPSLQGGLAGKGDPGCACKCGAESGSGSGQG